jgi:hypothetical protein
MKKTLDHLLKASGDAVAIVPLTHLETPSNLSEKKDLFEDFPGSKILQPSGFHQLLECKYQSGILGSLGTLEGNFLNRSNIVMVPLKAVSADSVEAMDTLNEINALIKNFISNLWHFRDNSVNSDAGYLFVNNDGQPIIHKNDMRLHFYNAHGQDVGTTSFNYKEIYSAALMASRSARHQMANARLAHLKPTKRVKGDSRVDCFITWVIDARRQDDVLTRIATYVTALEALLSTSNAELSHQLSERVALLNPMADALPPRDAFTEMKRAYGFRSKALHGATVQEKDQDSLLSTSRFLDQTCREFQLSILTSDEVRDHFKDNKSIDECVQEALFSR